MNYSLVRCCACEELKECVCVVNGHKLCETCVQDAEVMGILLQTPPHGTRLVRMINFVYPYSPN